MEKELIEAKAAAAALCISLQKLLVRAENKEDQIHWLKLSLSANGILKQFQYLRENSWLEKQLSTFQNAEIKS